MLGRMEAAGGGAGNATQAAAACAPESSPQEAAHAAWFTAVKAGDTSAVEALIAAGEHLEEGSGRERRCSAGATALLWASAEGYMPLMRLLLAHGCDVDARCSRAGGSALVWAASRNQGTAIRELLSAGADAGRPAAPQGGWNVQVRPSRAAHANSLAFATARS